MYYICDLEELNNQEATLQLNDYYIFNNVLSEDECLKITRELDDSGKTCEIDQLQYEWIYEKLSNLVLEANKAMWKFRISGFSEPIKYARLEDREAQAPRIDIGKNFDDSCKQNRKISMFLNLSEESAYTGGDMLLHNSGTPVYVTKTRGSCILFPSWLMNGITSVTKGQKRFLSAWVTGPPFS